MMLHSQLIIVLKGETRAEFAGKINWYLVIRVVYGTDNVNVKLGT